MNRTWHLLLLAALLLLGCPPEKTETPTKGRLQILVAESIAPPVLRQVVAFDSIYGSHGAQLTARVVPAELAVSRLILDTTRLILTPIPLSADEEAAVRRLAGSLSVIVVAYDAVSVVVHHRNAVDRITTAEVRDIIAGRLRRWEQLGKPNGKRGNIALHLQDSADVSSYLRARLLASSDVITPHRAWPEAIPLLRAVVADENALGIVGQSWIDSARVPAKQLDVAATEQPADTSFALVPESVGKFFAPHPAHVYRNYYPFRRKIFMYTKSLRGDIASGFGTFVANKEGQRIFLDAGLVPGTQPIKLRGGQ
ncbi:MAG: substrate-binding domain-containing protein [Bacteroidetes bacterium]|nr:substrate-binding domain-containing protein [Bacteroidota bacterium]